MKQTLKIALVQLNSTNQVEENLRQIRQYFNSLIPYKPDIIVTPEVSNFISGCEKLRQKYLDVEANDVCLKLLTEFAASNRIWVLAGSLALKSTPNNNNSYVNRSFLIDRNGKIRARYDKIHMFDVKLHKKSRYRESKYFSAGNKAIVVTTPLANFGLSICYDLRFPYLFSTLKKMGANVIFVPSAFTVTTGRQHWETLLRARAIENHITLIAPAQCGINGPQRDTWGHSLVVTPEGKVVTDMGPNPGTACVNIKIS